MIELRSLSLSYPLAQERLKILQETDARITAGETVAIVGPSGSGKTTLLLLLAGLEAPSAGTVCIAGTDLATLDNDAMADLRRDRLGIIFQSFHLVPGLTALANVALPLDIAGQADTRPKALAMLERVGLAERSHHYPAQLSGGEQQRVAIARAVIHRPDVLLADEPTGNLDAKTGAEIIDLLFELNHASGATLVLVTHDDSVAQRCDRVLQLHQGKLYEQRTNAIPG